MYYIDYIHKLHACCVCEKVKGVHVLGREVLGEYAGIGEQRPKKNFE